MTHTEETTYPIRINVPGRAPMEATLSTVGGKRVELRTWNQPHDPDVYFIKLVGSLDADVVDYAAVAFHPVKPA